MLSTLQHFFPIFSHCLSIVELQPSSSLSAGCVVPLRGDWAIFLPRWLRAGCQSVISQGEILKYTTLWLGVKPEPQGGQTVSYPTELSWTWPQGGQTASYPTEPSWPGPQGGQTASYLTELSHWAIMARTTGRTDSELSHWAIMADLIDCYNTCSNWLCRDTVHAPGTNPILRRLVPLG